MKVISMSSFKGGVGKSTICLLLGNVLAASGRRVLIIDLDHQQNATAYHATNKDLLARQNISEALHRGSLEGMILSSHIQNTDFVAGSFGLLQQRSASMRALKNLIDPVRENYDNILIDCHPSLDNHVIGAWIASDRILTPARLDSFDLEGLDVFQSALDREIPERNEAWRVAINFYRSRSTKEGSLGLLIEETIDGRYPVIRSRVPDSTAIFKAIHNGQGISTAQRTEKVYTAVLGMAEEITGENLIIKGGAI